MPPTDHLPPCRVRNARIEEHAELCRLFDQLDVLHRVARPDF